MDKTEKEKWSERMEDAHFLYVMFELYLKRTKQWESLWDELVGAKLHFRDAEWEPQYDEFDEDFIELFILRSVGDVVRKIVLFSEFLEWQENRMSR